MLANVDAVEDLFILRRHLGVTALVRYLGNDMERVAASNAMRGSHYLSSYSAPEVATHTQ